MSSDHRKSPYKSAGGFRRLPAAFRYSASGLKSAFSNEAAFRQELLLAALLLPGAFFLGTSLSQQLLLSVVILMVLVVELINSAIEAIADSVSLEWNPGLGLAKDLGSAAVMLSIFCAAFVWLAVLADRFLW